MPSWNRHSTDKNMTSQFEGYLSSIYDQEIPTKWLINKRQKDAGKETTCSTKCRLCKHSTEDNNYIISSCPEMPVRYYLPIRHDLVTKTVLKPSIVKDNLTHKSKHQDLEYIYRDCEFCSNISIQTATKLKHNKPNIIIWDKTEEICKIIEISCPADISVMKKGEEKLSNYGPLIRNHKIMYPQYKFQIAAIAIGALGYVPKCLEVFMHHLGFNKIETE